MSQTIQNSNIMWNRQSITGAMNKRSILTEADAKAGKLVRLTIRGNGNWIDVKNAKGELVQSKANEGIVLRKKIFNVFSNSDVAMRNPTNKALLQTAVAAEKAGEKQKAANYYNEFMNSVEVSFSVLDNQRVVNRLSDRMQIDCNLQLIETDRGKVISVDAASIRIVEAEAAAKTSFNLDDFFGDAPESADATAEVIGADELGALHTA